MKHQGLEMHQRVFSCDLNCLEDVRQWFKDGLKSLNIQHPADEEVERLTIALNEVVTNVIIHANHSDADRQMTLSLKADCNSVEVAVAHHGDEFSPDSISLPDCAGLPDGGFGLYIIHQIFDIVEYAHDKDGQKTIRLVRKFA